MHDFHHTKLFYSFTFNKTKTSFLCIETVQGKITIIVKVIFKAIFTSFNLKRLQWLSLFRRYRMTRSKEKYSMWNFLLIFRLLLVYCKSILMVYLYACTFTIGTISYVLVFHSSAHGVLITALTFSTCLSIYLHVLPFLYGFHFYFKS